MNKFISVIIVMPFIVIIDIYAYFRDIYGYASQYYDKYMRGKDD